MKQNLNRKHVPVLMGIFTFLFLWHSVSGQDAGAKLPIDPNVKIGKLSNGLTYYIRKNGKPEKKVELRLVVNAGSILEDDDQQGLAHFVEHMAFNGSKNFKKNDIVSFLQSIGVEFGADLNAYTGFDETVYILPIPTEKKENIEKGFQILEDWASTVAFDGGEIDKERGVVLEESRGGKGADDRIFRVVYPKMFEGSKYAERLPIGKDDILKNFKYDVIKRFYHDWYRPDLMAVIVVGDLDPAEAERYIKSHFEKIKPATNPRQRILADVPARSKSEALIVTDKEATNHVIDIYYPAKKEKVDVTVGDYREYLVRRLFTSMISQRMQELVQKADPPFVFGGTFIGGYARGFESFQSIAYVAKGGPEAAINALIQENERARKFGFTAAELDRNKKMMMKGIERSYNERDKTESANFVDEYVNHFLTQESIPGIENEYKYHKDYLEGITLQQVNTYAANNLPEPSSPKLIILTGPETADFKIPTKEALMLMADNATKAEIKPYEEKEIATALLEKKPTPGKITTEKQNAAIGTTTLSLSNGVTVILKPTDFKNDQIVMNATRFGGQFLFDAKDRFSAEFASTIVSQMGVGAFSPVDLRKVLAGKSASVSPRIGTVSETLTGSCSAVDLETMLQLTYLNFTAPRKDQDLFTSFVTKQQTLYQNMSSNPEYAFQDSVLKILYHDHPWAPKVPKAESIGQINLDRSLEIYKARFGDATGFTFVIVGKFDLSTIKPLLETYLGSLPASGKKSTYKDAGVRRLKGQVKAEIRKGTEQKSMISLMWHGDTPYDDRENLKLQALAEVLNIKIIESLREDLGGIYSGSVVARMNKFPYPNYIVSVNLPCGPENVDKLITATQAEVDKIKKEGPSVNDLNKVKETWRQQYEVNIKDNSFWLGQLIQSVELGADPTGILSYEQRISAITPKEIQEAAIKYISEKNYAQFILNPEK